MNKKNTEDKKKRIHYFSSVETLTDSSNIPSLCSKFYSSFLASFVQNCSNNTLTSFPSSKHARTAKNLTPFCPSLCNSCCAKILQQLLRPSCDRNQLPKHTNISPFSLAKLDSNITPSCTKSSLFFPHNYWLNNNFFFSLLLHENCSSFTPNQSWNWTHQKHCLTLFVLTGKDLLPTTLFTLWSQQNSNSLCCAISTLP